MVRNLKDAGTIKDITQNQKDTARKLIKSKSQSPFVKMDAKKTLKQLEMLGKK